MNTIKAKIGKIEENAHFSIVNEENSYSGHTRRLFLARYYNMTPNEILYEYLISDFDWMWFWAYITTDYRGFNRNTTVPFDGDGFAYSWQDYIWRNMGYLTLF